MLFPPYTPTVHGEIGPEPPATAATLATVFDGHSLERTSGSNFSNNSRGQVAKSASSISDLPHDPAPLIDAYHERVAGCLEAGDVPVAQAHQVARAEVGTDLDSLAQRQVEHWGRKLTSLQVADTPWVVTLLADCRRLLQTEWVYEAIKTGWSDAELYGLHMSAPKVRVEAMGLATWLALSRLNRRIKVVRVTPSNATIVTASSAELTHQRFHPSLGPPIWEHPAFINGGSLP